MWLKASRKCRVVDQNSVGLRACARKMRLDYEKWCQVLIYSTFNFMFHCGYFMSNFCTDTLLHFGCLFQEESPKKSPENEEQDSEKDKSSAVDNVVCVLFILHRVLFVNLCVSKNLRSIKLHFRA